MNGTGLDSESLGPVGQRFFEFASKRMRGQETAIRRLAKALDHAESPLRQKDKPIYTVLLVGGAGSGKTHLAKVLADFWFGNPEGTTSIKCSDFEETVFSQNVLMHHDYTHQLNSGPHKEVLQAHMKLVKDRSELEEKLGALKESMDKESDNKRTAKMQKQIAVLEQDIAGRMVGIQNLQKEVGSVFAELRSILVLDHIECADSDIQEALYDMLESGKRIKYVQQSGYQEVSLVNSVIFITCSDWVEPEKDSSGSGKRTLGFEAGQAGPKKSGGKDVHLSGMAELKEYLSPKILSRIVRVEFFRPYDDASRLEIVNLLIGELEEHLMVRGFPVVLRIEDSVKKFIVAEGSDHPQWGIRLLKQKFDKYITWKLENLVQKGLIKPNDFLAVSLKEIENTKHRVVFEKVNV